MNQEKEEKENVEKSRKIPLICADQSRKISPTSQ